MWTLAYLATPIESISTTAQKRATYLTNIAQYSDWEQDLGLLFVLSLHIGHGVSNIGLIAFVLAITKE